MHLCWAPPASFTTLSAPETTSEAAPETVEAAFIPALQPEKAASEIINATAIAKNLFIIFILKQNIIASTLDAIIFYVFNLFIRVSEKYLHR